MRVVITGGTGFIGSHLVPALASRGDDVIVLTRERRLPQERVTYVHWTPEDAGPWLDEIDNADVVMHLAGAPVLDKAWSPERLDELTRSRVVPARLIAERIKRNARDRHTGASTHVDAGSASSAKPRVFISSSAVGYYGMRDDAEPCLEDHGPGDDPLARICIDWEKAVDPARDAGVRIVHPRIGIVLGKEGGALSKMLPAFRAFCGGPVGAGTQYFPWIHIEDTVRALLFAIDTDTLSGPVNVVAPEPVTMNELAKTIGCALGRPAFMRVPAFACKMALGERGRTILTGQRALPQKLDAANFAFLFPEIRGALADLLGPPPPAD